MVHLEPCHFMIDLRMTACGRKILPDTGSEPPVPKPGPLQLEHMGIYDPSIRSAAPENLPRRQPHYPRIWKLGAGVSKVPPTSSLGAGLYAP